ncbi:MAG: DUF134 domain-containing protein [Clostridiales bacterium]|nr:DUF134 domain-containing protein [Clostridiales bacterium]
MARPQKCRCICSIPKTTCFEPAGGAAETVTVGYDEYEVFRLLDYERFSQLQCAERMRISRATVARMYENVRRKLAEALVQGKRIVIAGGDVVVCAKIKPECAGAPHCCHRRKETGGP